MLKIALSAIFIFLCGCTSTHQSNNPRSYDNSSLNPVPIRGNYIILKNEEERLQHQERPYLKKNQMDKKKR